VSQSHHLYYYPQVFVICAYCIGLAFGL